MGNSTGLNESQRALTMGMVIGGSDGREIRYEIAKMARENDTGWDKTDWSYKENVRLVAELASRGEVRTARYLQKLIDGETDPRRLLNGYGDG